MEVQKLKIKEELHLSGAYIRSLVKQLSSSNSKESKLPRSSPDAAASGGGSSTNLKLGCGSTQKRRERDTQAPRKKQVRRRLHTVKPYQERVLNMAEARREIVAALKQHRASMRRANEDHQQQSRPQEEEEDEEEIRQAPHSSSPPGAAPQNDPISQWNPEVYPSYFAGRSSISSANCPQFPNLENLSFILPRMPLGLNLNFHGFGRESAAAAAAATHESSCSMSCASCMSNLSSPEVRSTSEAPPPASESTGAPNAQNLHLAMNDEEIAEIKSIGEQYDVEWNDQLNSVTSAWWCNYLQVSEGPPEIQAWSGDQQPLDGYSGKDNMQDTALPCSDVNGGVEDMNYDWLA